MDGAALKIHQKSLCFTRISIFTHAQLDQKLVVLWGKFDLYLECSVQLRASAKHLFLWLEDYAKVELWNDHF